MIQSYRKKVVTEPHSMAADRDGTAPSGASASRRKITAVTRETRRVLHAALIETEIHLDALLVQSDIADDAFSIELIHAVRERLKQMSDRLDDVKRAPQKRRPDETHERTGYPRFEVRGDTFVRIGWSKQANGEYERQVPRDICEQALTAIKRSGASPRIGASVDQVVAHLERNGARNSIKASLAHAALAMLEEAGKIARSADQGYHLP